MWADGAPLYQSQVQPHQRQALWAQGPALETAEGLYWAAEVQVLRGVTGKSGQTEVVLVSVYEV